MASRKTAPKKIAPRINYTRDIFSRRIRDRSTLIDSCFLLLPSLGFKLVLDFDFCVRKNFINTVRLKLLKKEEQVKHKLSIE